MCRDVCDCDACQEHTSMMLIETQLLSQHYRFNPPSDVVITVCAKLVFCQDEIFCFRFHWVYSERL